MNLDDYIKKEEEQRKTAIPNWATAFYDIDTLNVTPSKRELIKSFKNYIKNYDFNIPINYNLPLYKKLDPNEFPHQILEQIETTDKKNMCILIETTYFDGADTCIITEEEYKKRMNKYKKSGSQSFFALDAYKIFKIRNSFRIISMEEIIKKTTNIFYSMDGKAFITTQMEQELSKITDDELGRVLAEEAVDLKQKVYKK